jgi:hypothetical protein
MANKKISQLTAAAALTGTEIVPIVQGGVTVQTTAQDVADLGGGFSFSYLMNPNSGIISIVNAVEGISIPNSSTATYTKTVPLLFTAPTAIFGCFLYDSVNSGGLGSSQVSFSYDYGITNSGLGSSGNGVTSDVDSVLRFVAFQDYTQSFRAQDYVGAAAAGSGFGEIDETGTFLLPGLEVLKTPTYTQLNNNFFGIYNGPYSSTSKGIGYSSSSAVVTQLHSIIKAIYISGNNLVFNFKKRAATSGETWTKLNLRIYNFS